METGSVAINDVTSFYAHFSQNVRNAEVVGFPVPFLRVNETIILPWSKTSSLFHCMCFDHHLYRYTYMYTYIVG